MKKICSFLLFFLIFNISFPVNNNCYSITEKVVYAKAKNDCILYKSQQLDNLIDNVYFIVPESYFMTILEEIDQICIKVHYGNYIGYVSSDSIIVASFIPNVKNLSGITCDIKQTSGTQVWNKPSTSGNVLTTIPAGTLKIDYIASAYGDIPSGGESNLWYYVMFTPLSNSTSVYEGYVYSENTTNLSEIVLNTENNPEVVVEENDINEEAIYISPTIKTVITALISVPIIILFAIILYKLIKIVTKNTNKMKNINKRNYDDFNNFSTINNNFSNEKTNFESKSVLQTQIDKMKNTSFKKSQNINLRKNSKYPEFPVYSSEDDLL